MTDDFINYLSFVLNCKHLIYDLWTGEKYNKSLTGISFADIFRRQEHKCIFNL